MAFEVPLTWSGSGFEDRLSEMQPGECVLELPPALPPSHFLPVNCSPVVEQAGPRPVLGHKCLALYGIPDVPAGATAVKPTTLEGLEGGGVEEVRAPLTSSVWDATLAHKHLASLSNEAGPPSVATRSRVVGGAVGSVLLPPNCQEETCGTERVGAHKLTAVELGFHDSVAYEDEGECVLGSMSGTFDTKNTFPLLRVGVWAEGRGTARPLLVL